MNCLVEITDNGRQQAALFGMPGLRQFIDTGSLPIRGIVPKDGTLTFYLAVGNRVIVSEANQPLRTVATLDTHIGPVWMDDNGVQLFINDGSSPFIYTYQTGVATPITDPDYPRGARGAVFLAGRFWVFVPAINSGKDGRCYSSDQQNGLAWDGLNFFTPAARPDGILAIERRGDDLAVIGQKTIEWWSQGPVTLQGALGFIPSSSANSDVGGIAERGAAIVDQRFLFLGKEKSTARIYEANGYQVTAISTPAVEDSLSKVSGLTSAVCCSYTVSGHPLFQITVPGGTKQTAVTWVYDLSTKLWSKRGSVNKPYYRGLLTAATLNNVYMTDAFNGKLYVIDPETNSDDGEPSEFEVTSTYLMKDGDSLILHAVWVDCETGIGNAVPPGDDPQAIMQISKDGGRTWGQEHFIPLGKIGDYTRQAKLRRLGSAKKFAIKFRILEPVPRRVVGAYLLMEPGNA